MFKSLLILSAVALALVLVGCREQNSMGVVVKGHSVSIKRQHFTSGNTKYDEGKFFKYWENSDKGKFEFIIDGDKISVNGEVLGSLRARDEVRVNDDGISVWNAEGGKWLDNTASKAYLAQNNQPENVAKE